MKKLIAITAWLVLVPVMMCPASNFNFHNVDTTDGLADNFVRDIFCECDGHIWFSTINGLSRYDGYRLYNYMPRESGHSNDIAMVRETADHTLWMLCSGHLYTYNRVKDTWQEDGAKRLEQLGIEGTMKVFYVDDQFNLWVATEAGLYWYNYSASRLHHVANSNKLPVLHIVSKNETTVVVSTDYIIYKVDQIELRLVQVAQIPTKTYSRDSRVFLDQRMNLWVFTSHSLAGLEYVFSMKTRQWCDMPEFKKLGDAFVNTITEDNHGNLWVGTGNAGIHVFKYQDDGQALHEVATINPFASHNSHISCLYLDKNNTMWVGSAKLGVAFTDLSSPDFNIVYTGDYQDVSSLLQDRKGNLWVGFDGEGLMMKSPDNTTTYYSALAHQLPSNIVTSLALHTDGAVLVGTYGEGIARFNGTRFVPLYEDSPQLKYIKDMTTDANGNLWVATVDRGVVKVRTDGRIINYTSDNSSLASNGVICLAMDSLKDIIYIGTSAGVSAFDCAKDQFIQNDYLAQMKGVYVTSIMVCSRNILWIGSRNGLWVYRTKDGVVDHLTTEQGMSHNTVRALAKSRGRIWVSTDNGLTCVTFQQTDQGHISYNCLPFFKSDGLHNTVFSNNASLTTPEGTILLGCYSGYVSIPLEEVVKPEKKMQVQFTDFRINGKDAPKFRSSYTLKHNERLTVFLSAMIPALSHKVRYLYRFKGEKEWNMSPDNMLYFVALQSGKHVLQVKAQLPGDKESRVAELSFRVLPPLWLTWQAILVYLLLAVLLIYLIYRAMRLRQKREFAIKQLELNLKKYEVEEDKIRFFTNIGHDLKTPLTLVVAPLEKLRQTNLPASLRTELDVAWRNAHQLQDLVMELLDFRRLDVGKEKLNLKHGDIVGFVRQIAQGFAYYATMKQVKLMLQLPPSSVEINFDENKMRRIITNLLSNAYKYNTDNGTVTLSLNVNQEQMDISVADTGIGVKDKRHIFDRFVQETHGQEQEGSGLGLHIVKQYVDMMGGNITVEDNHPKGSVFTVTIPLNDTVETIVEEVPANAVSVSENEDIPEDKNNDKPTIMVVDDNKDARLFLQRSLDNDYNVIVATNGQDALSLLNQSEKVDLIVSDVMMPVMDGMELLKKVKADINYSHIPVILLTAKSGEENIVSGLKEDAADYITKPFSLSVLQLKVKKILEWTRNVHQQVATGIEIKPSEITVSSLDEELISRVIAFIENNIQKSDYSVVDLSNDVGMTRGHLYKKLQAITGKSPLEFMRIIKLKRGKSLLEQGRTNISEVADRVGMSPKQFSLYFKQMFGDTPSDFLKKFK